MLTHLGGHDGIDRSYAALGIYVGGTPTDPARFTATEICWPIFSTTAPQ